LGKVDLKISGYEIHLIQIHFFENDISTRQILDLFTVITV